MKYSCYVLTEYSANSFFATCDERSAMNCTVTLYTQSKQLLFVCNLTLLGYNRVLGKRFGGPGIFSYAREWEPW